MTVVLPTAGHVLRFLYQANIALRENIHLAILAMHVCLTLASRNTCRPFPNVPTLGRGEILIQSITARRAPENELYGTHQFDQDVAACNAMFHKVDILTSEKRRQA